MQPRQVNWGVRPRGCKAWAMRYPTLGYLLVGSAASGAATPWNYSSLRFFRLTETGAGDLIYGYRQTIYAHILCRWEVSCGVDSSG